MKYTEITDIEQVDILRHAIIEASAGTGKTYTIENLVVRILLERPEIRLENILLVTFTEKATSELKIRIRAKLEAELEKKPERVRAEKIKAALDSFDSASIYTIHGFCQAILRDLAFENKAPFQWDLIDDGRLFERLFKEQIRKKWPKTFREYLPDFLEISGFIKSKEKFESTVISAARFYREESGDRLLPPIDSRSVSDAVETIGKIRKLVRRLKKISKMGVLCGGFEKLNAQKPQKRVLKQNILEPLRKFLSEMDSDNFKITPLIKILWFIHSKGTGYLSPKFLKNGGPNPEACPDWDEVANVLTNLYGLFMEAKDVLTAGSVFQLRADARNEKLKNGWISFDDMLLLVHQALHAPGGEPLRSILRKKFKAAFVDEFQDTDPVQWQIFKKIFLENKKANGENHLFLIGDPKQAIYAFRGADVHTYLGARKHMERLQEKGEANCYSLPVNWRSDPRLLDIFNRLFSSQYWFAPVGELDAYTIGYQPVKAPDEKKRIYSLKRDLSLRSSFNVIDLTDALSLKTAKLVLARFIAQEIRYLINNGGVRWGRKDMEAANLRFSDISILVRGKSEAPFLEKELSRLNIPYSYYKKPGLNYSDEAFFLSAVFHAISDPGDASRVNKALLTPFFDLTPEEIYRGQDLNPNHPIKSLLHAWTEYAEARRWGRLFQSMMEDSGLIFRESEKSDWERKYANYRQIFEHLQDVAYRENLDCRGITAVLDGFRKGRVRAETDADLHQIETEEEKVQIMTMHVAKGLEFPVVFVFGGLTQASSYGTDYYVFHEIPDNSEPYKVFDFTKSYGKDKQNAEIEEEEKRLYYVALTRARLKLYVPCFELEKRTPWIGPVSRLITPSLIEAFGNSARTDYDVSFHNPGFLKSAHDGFGIDGPEIRNIPAELLEQRRNSLGAGPFFPETGSFVNRKVELASFSSIHSSIESKRPPLGNGLFGFSSMAEKAREDDETYASDPTDLSEEVGGANDIPGGTEIGSMFHDIFENISFKTVMEAPEKEECKASPLFEIAETRELVEKKMGVYRIHPRWLKPVCEVVFDALRSPIFHLSKNFSLASLTDGERLHEVEFYFPHPKPFHRQVDECENCDGFIRGFVDLIFIYQNKFYIADWKSNVLHEGYSPESMEDSMNRSGYHLQYKIYTIATLKWLANGFRERFVPERDFGGVFYFYIRGMGGENGEGIYHVPAEDLQPLSKLEVNLAQPDVFRR